VPLTSDQKRLQVVSDIALAEAVEEAARRCGLSVSDLLERIIREAKPATIVGVHASGRLRRVLDLSQV
jgi:hypothetical protein